MTVNLMVPLVLAMTVAGARAQDRTQSAVPAESVPAAYPATPRMELVGLDGNIRVERPSGPRKNGLPDILPGSVVRVLSGNAQFETDYGAVVNAEAGDAFRFDADAPNGSTPGRVRIASESDRVKPALRVDVGGRRFRLMNEGVVTIEGTAPEESTVRAEKGTMERPSVMMSRGSSGDANQPLLANQHVAVSVAPPPGFAYAPVTVDALTVAPRGRNAFEVRGSNALHAARAAAPPLAVRPSADQAIQSWPDTSRAVAQETLSEYGPPDEIAADRLVWNHRPPWQRVVVYRTAASARPGAQEDVLEQTVAYDVPADKIAEIQRADLGVTADTSGLTAVSPSERNNFLSLNLAHDIIIGSQTAEQARASYDRIYDTTVSGKASPYTQSLMFVPARPE
jgi:hypothetical protein